MEHRRRPRVLALVCALVVVAASSGCTSGSPGSPSPGTPANDPALAADAQAAAAPLLAELEEPLGRPPIYSVAADSDGLVIITLNFTKEYYLGDRGGGEVALDDLAAALATSVFDAVPAAQEVATFDANKDLLESYKRSDRK